MTIDTPPRYRRRQPAVTPKRTLRKCGPFPRGVRPVVSVEPPADARQRAKSQ